MATSYPPRAASRGLCNLSAPTCPCSSVACGTKYEADADGSPFHFRWIRFREGSKRDNTSIPGEKQDRTVPLPKACREMPPERSCYGISTEVCLCIYLFCGQTLPNLTHKHRMRQEDRTPLTFRLVMHPNYSQPREATRASDFQSRGGDGLLHTTLSVHILTSTFFPF